MEDSLKEAAGGEDKQISIESIMNPAKEDEEGAEDDGNAWTYWECCLENEQRP